MSIEEIKNVALNMQAFINNNLLKDVMRLQEENAALRECLETLAGKLRCPTDDGRPKKGVWCGICREVCTADGENWCDRNTYYPIIDAALAKASGKEVKK